MRNKDTIGSRGLRGKSYDYFQGDKLKKEGDLLYKLYTRRKYLENLFQGFSFGEPQTITKVGPPLAFFRGAFNPITLKLECQAFLAAAFAALAVLPRVLIFFTLVLGRAVLSSFKRAALPRSSRR